MHHLTYASHNRAKTAPTTLLRSHHKLMLLFWLKPLFTHTRTISSIILIIPHAKIIFKLLIKFYDHIIYITLATKFSSSSQQYLLQTF